MKHIGCLLSVLLSLLPQTHAGLVKGNKDLGGIWFIGDSITQANGDGDPAGSPRASLHRLLVEHGYSFSFTGHFAANPEGLPVTGNSPEENLFQFHSGISGAVIGASVDGRTGITQNLPGFWRTGRLATVKPNLILIMLGANDINANIHADTAPERLIALIDTIRVQPNVGNPTILLASITPNRVPSSKAGARVKAYNDSIPGVVEKLRKSGCDIHYVDQFGPLEKEYDASMDLDGSPEKTRYDHLHPGPHGNQLMAGQWFKKIRELVEAR